VSEAEREAVGSVFAGAGEMRERCRALDWAATPLGPVSRWPEALRTIVRTSMDSPFPINLWCGPELVLIYNDGYRRALGAKHPGALGRRGPEVWAEIWPEIGPWFERMRRGGEPVFAEDAPFEVRRAGRGDEGELAWFTFGLSPVRDGAGEIVAFFNPAAETTGRLIAERRLVEAREAAERAESRLREVFAQAPAFLAVLRGPEHVFEFANDAYFQLVGHRAILGKKVAEALPEVVEQGFIGVLDGVYRTGEPFIGREILVKLERAPGAPLEDVYVDFVYQPLREAGATPVGIVAHGSDVTVQVAARREIERLLRESEQARAALAKANEQLERQQTELEATNEQLQESAAELEQQAQALDEVNAELRASERRFRDLYEQAPVAVAVLEGPEHVYTMMSSRYAQYLGARPLLGLPFREAAPEVGPEVPRLMDVAYETGVAQHETERLVRIDRDRDGVPEDYYFNVGYQPLRDAAGRVYAVASISLDVTDQVRARQEIEAARAEAEEANRAKSQFLATMSHELRTPLNAIGGYAELLLLGVRGELNAAQREDVERMRRSGQHLLGLINDILNFAKLEAGQVEFHIHSVPLGPLVGEIDDLIRPQVAAKALRYEPPECDPALRVCADPEKVRQILLNLVANAVKFTDPGGTVAVRCAVDGGRALVHVTDTGRGIARDQLRRIFDPFVQVDRHITPASQQGVGLGLAISRDLASGMGGTLTAESEVGRGSTFTLALPLDQGAGSREQVAEIVRSDDPARQDGSSLLTPHS
jgi:signal transduction histidine kinase